VIDEVLGMLVSLFLIPNGLAAVVAAFFFFRFFDIVKPFPARHAERARGGWGVMLDDVVAGVYANACVRLLLFAGERLL
jgi:phosphatidylglycerophosphatase A